MYNTWSESNHLSTLARSSSEETENVCKPCGTRTSHMDPLSFVPVTVRQQFYCVSCAAKFAQLVQNLNFVLDLAFKIFQKKKKKVTDFLISSTGFQ